MRLCWRFLRDNDLGLSQFGWYRNGGHVTFVNQKIVTVKGAHFIQEDSPDEIGEAIAGWFRSL